MGPVSPLPTMGPTHRPLSRKQTAVDRGDAFGRCIPIITFAGGMRGCAHPVTLARIGDQGLDRVGIGARIKRWTQQAGALGYLVS